MNTTPTAAFAAHTDEELLRAHDETVRELGPLIEQGRTVMLIRGILSRLAQPKPTFEARGLTWTLNTGEEPSKLPVPVELIRNNGNTAFISSGPISWKLDNNDPQAIWGWRVPELATGLLEAKDIHPLDIFRIKEADRQALWFRPDALMTHCLRFRHRDYNWNEAEALLERSQDNGETWEPCSKAVDSQEVAE